MLFRPTLLLSLLGAATASSQVANAPSPRKLQAGDYEVVIPATAGVSFHYNVGDGNGGTGTTITEPTVLLGFEHDDVTKALTATQTAIGYIVVTHYEGGCKNVIEPGLVGSEIGGATTMPPNIGDGNGEVEKTATGLGADYQLTLKNGATPPVINGVLTVIRYKLGLLDQDTRITRLVGGTEYVTNFCTRLSLMSLDADVEVGFREVDVTVKHAVNSVTQVTLTTSEEGTTEITEDFGEYSVRSFFATPGSSPAAPTPAPGDAPTSTPGLQQGEEFTVAFVPQRTYDKDDNTNTPDVTEDATEMDIISVDECFFWLDENNDGFWIQGELRQFVVLGGAAVSPFGSGLVCDSAIVVAGATDDIEGCALTVTLPSTFFSGSSTSVRGVCTVTLEFDGTSVSGRRQLQLTDGDQGQVTTSAALLVAREAETDDDCWAGCFFLFCPLNIVICWIQDFFSNL